MGPRVKLQGNVRLELAAVNLLNFLDIRCYFSIYPPMNLSSITAAILKYKSFSKNIDSFGKIIAGGEYRYYKNGYDVHV